MNEPSNYSFEEDSSRIQRHKEDLAYEQWSNRISTLFDVHANNNRPSSSGFRHEFDDRAPGGGSSCFYHVDVTGCHTNRFSSGKSPAGNTKDEEDAQEGSSTAYQRWVKATSAAHGHVDGCYYNEGSPTTTGEEDRYPHCFMGQILLASGGTHRSVSVPVTPHKDLHHNHTNRRTSSTRRENDHEEGPHQYDNIQHRSAFVAREPEDEEEEEEDREQRYGAQLTEADDRRIASRLKTFMRHEKYGSKNEANHFTAWEGGVVAADAELLNKELHEMLMHVRARNAVSEEARRQLQRSKVVSATIKEPLSSM